jgi:CHASE1-domain containing sensor protein/DNA-binding CsgD family transcriptional regulator
MPPLSTYIAKLGALPASLRTRLYPGGIPGHHKFVAIALLLAIALFVHLNGQLSALSRERNEAEVAALATTISSRMEAYAEIVTGAAAFYSVVGQVSRQSWKKYFDRLTLDESLPGVQGLGFNQLVGAKEKAAHERKVRAEGIPDYAVWPKGERDEYTPVVFIEPYSGRNLRALGYDTYSDEVRRRAMLIAKETKKPALTDRIVLVQETGKEIQHGYVMYLPVHRIKDIETRDTAEKTSDLIGWVSAPFRVDDLLKTVVGLRRFQNIAFELYDSADLEKPIYTHSPTGSAFKVVSGQETRNDVPVANRRWLLHAKHVNVSSDGLGEMDTFIKWFLAIAFLSSLVLLLLRDSATRKKTDTEGEREQDSPFPPQESGPDSTDESAAAAVESLDALLTQFGLTPRQTEVLHMLLAGASNKAICRKLNLSEATVKVHVSAILKALRVQSRYQLTNALKALENK